MPLRFVLFLSGLTVLATLAACGTPAEIPGRGGVPLPAGVDVALLGATQEVVASGFTIPWGIEVLGEQEFLVTERLGRLFHYHDGTLTALGSRPVEIARVFLREMAKGKRLDFAEGYRRQAAAFAIQADADQQAEIANIRDRGIAHQ